MRLLISLSISIAYSARGCSVTQIRIEFDEDTLLLREARENVPYTEWDDRVEEYRAPAYRNVLDWADTWTDEDSPSAGQESAHQETIQSAGVAVEDTARA